MAIVMAFVVLVPTLGCSGQGPIVPQAGAGKVEGGKIEYKKLTPKKAEAETEEVEVEAAELEIESEPKPQAEVAKKSIEPSQSVTHFRVERMGMGD